MGEQGDSGNGEGGAVARRLVVALAATAAWVLSGLAIAPNPPAAAQAERHFPETGFTVRGRFLDRWAAYGGLVLNGYPITPERTETLEDGQPYLVQWFERARLELHPENAPPNDVLLGQFGRLLHPADPPVSAILGMVFFPETGHNVPPDFAAYYAANGGLSQFGYPLSEVFTEVLEDGRPYEVQYTERSRFERHPEVADPAYRVLLGQFGRRILAMRGAQPPSPPSGEDRVLVGAGDIASCSSRGDEATAALLDAIPGTVYTLGDNVYDSGSTSEFTTCYHPTWGRHKVRTRPAAGNHDYGTVGAAGYYGYFGAAAGDPGRGYYSYDLGAWHVVVLNSNCAAVGGCGPGSPQERWLRADLAAHPSPCILAYWHHPRWSSGTTHGSSTSMASLWDLLYDHGADVVLAGHEHHYERFAPMDKAGARDDAPGIRSFLVGTGGRSHYGFGASLPTSEARNSDTYGLLKLTLMPDGYEWQFVPEAGKTYTDSGSAPCH